MNREQADLANHPLLLYSTRENREKGFNHSSKHRARDIEISRVIDSRRYAKQASEISKTRQASPDDANP